MNPEILRLIGIAGSQQALADTIGKSQQSVSKWKLGLAQPSAQAAVSIEKTYGTPAHVLRPDIFL